ncbi:PspC domain-containing protein [Nocardia sp. NPDC088792]|uniref:PspC domain-containing protein n=1 Tax=Nocardia sp. NPDC088792 TaxID=3364332 RepID=UPI00380B5ADB
MTRTSDWSRSAGRAGFSDQIHDIWRTRPLRMPKHGPVAGVAAGFGRRYGVDPVLVRVAFVVSALFGGAGIVLYLLCWLLLSQNGDRNSPAESLFGKGQSSQNSSKTIVLMVALGIAVSTMGPVGIGLGGSGVISFLLMLGGWWLLYQRQPVPPAGYLEQAAPDSFLNTGYPGTTNPYWTGVPGNAVTFEAYGPYTKLPDHYEPDPNLAQQPLADESPTEVLAAQRIPVTDTATAVLNTTGPSDEAPTINLRADGDLAKDDAETVVLHKNASGPGTPVDLDKGLPAGTSGAPDVSGAEDSAAQSAAGSGQDTPQDAPPTDSKPPALHRIPPTSPLAPRSFGGYGPAPISPEFGPTPPGWDPLGVAPLAWDLPEPRTAVREQPPVQTLPSRPRSRLTPVTIGLAILAAAAAGAMAASGIDWMTPGRIGAAALAVLGIGLVIGAFMRRGHGLMVLLAPLAGFVILASLIGPIQFDKGAMGDHRWAAVTGSELEPVYHVTMGSATLDLSRLQLTEDRATTVKVRMGDARVVLPPNLRVHTECTVRMGDSNCLTGWSGPATGPALNLTVDVQMGNAEVKRG